MNVPLPHFPAATRAQFWWVVGIMVADRRSCMLALLPPAADWIW